LALSAPVRDEASLVEGIVAGRPSAVAQLYDRYAPVVRGMLARMLGGSRDLDDLAQETFLTVVRRCASLRDPTALRSFVASVAMRTARNELRRRALRRFVGLQDAPAAASVGPRDHEVAEQVRRVYGVLDRLDAGARLAFVARHVEGYELAEAAAICGCSLATFKRRLARADRRFQAMARTDPVLRALTDDGRSSP
jgi:RNA polymerase sigma-70 factor (ECF subfamily)